MQTIYRCENCGKEFDDWQTCLSHEKAHIQIESTKPYFPNDEQYPSSIEVTFSNGSVGTYFLDGNITTKQKDSSPDVASIQES